MVSEMVINVAVAVGALVFAFLVFGFGTLISQQAILASLAALLVVLVAGVWLYRRVS
jgi:hypothetical protein